MHLLDAILAFALTMAALATVVTTIMEAIFRMARMRKKNFVEVMKLLNKELKNGPLGMDDQERWQFFVRVVENPAVAAIEKLEPELKNLSIDDRLAYFGHAKSNGAGIMVRIVDFFEHLIRDKKRASLYENVSLEYMLRCLAETKPIKNTTRVSKEIVTAEFNKIARKYEEFGSSVSANFKRHAQTWSIAVGIGLALFANIDGLRIFETYRLDPGLAATLISKQEEITESHQEAQKRMDQLRVAEKKVEDAKAQLAKAKKEENKPEQDRWEETLADARTRVEAQAGVDAIGQTIERARQQVSDLVALGVPIGWHLYPSCPYGGTDKQWRNSSPKCRAIPMEKRERKVVFENFHASVANTALNDVRGFALWLLIVVITGVLIGLGAPFWFDVAKRIAQIRKGLQKASASAEYRLSARDANGDLEKKKEIVANVIAEAAGEAAARSAAVSKGRAVLSPDGTEYGKGTQV